MENFDLCLQSSFLSFKVCHANDIVDWDTVFYNCSLLEGKELDRERIYTTLRHQRSWRYIFSSRQQWGNAGRCSGGMFWNMQIVIMWSDSQNQFCKSLASYAVGYHQFSEIILNVMSLLISCHNAWCNGPDKRYELNRTACNRKAGYAIAIQKLSSIYNTFPKHFCTYWLYVISFHGTFIESHIRKEIPPTRHFQNVAGKRSLEQFVRRSL